MKKQVNRMISLGRLLRHIVAGCVVMVLLVRTASQSAAEETDQFLLPPREKFEDIGPFLSLAHYRVLEDVVDQINGRLERALHMRNPHRRATHLARLQSSAALADGVRNRFGSGFIETRAIESALNKTIASTAVGDGIIAYKSHDWIYAGAHFPVDPRRLILMFNASTVRAYDVYFGVDKLAHFHDVGHMYYKNYLNLRQQGNDSEDAIGIVVSMFSEGLISEATISGVLSTGVYSNADLASNYAGLLFYKNLTREIVIDDQILPPLVVQIGEFWALNRHVRPDSDFLRPFITQHWNEALNPNWYEGSLRRQILSRLQEHADDILAFYADDDGQPHDREYFEQKARELSTYFGRDYGHRGFGDGTIGIAEGCFPEDANDDDRTAPDV